MKELKLSLSQSFFFGKQVLLNFLDSCMRSNEPLIFLIILWFSPLRTEAPGQDVENWLLFVDPASKSAITIVLAFIYVEWAT